MISLAANADFDSHQVLVRSFSDKVNMFVLTSNTESHQTVPAGATRVIISGTAVYYTKIGPTGTAAAIPSGNVTDGTGSAIQSAGYALSSTDTVISFISPSSCIVSLEYYN